MLRFFNSLLISHFKNVQEINYRTIFHTKQEFDIDYLCNTRNFEEINNNIKKRKGVGDIYLVQELNKQLLTAPLNEHTEIKNKLEKALMKIPNKTHHAINFNEPKVLKTVGKTREFDFKPRDFHEITKRMHLARTEHLGHLTGSRSYYLYGALAALEQALVKYSLHFLFDNGFRIISVPDLLDKQIIEGCGLDTEGERTQVYSLDHTKHGENKCLSGTSEMAIAGYLANKVFDVKKLPLKVAAVSRCYRAETSSIAEEQGIFRVHQFSKVEMFAVTTVKASDEMLDQFRAVEEQLFESLNLHYKTLDMPAHELGAPAYRKFDIEAWMPGRNMFGEISSCSNCIDYQSRRLNIKYRTPDGKLQHVHTINGTACAIPRTLIAIVENGQNNNGTVDLPPVLHKYMNNNAKIVKQKGIPELKLVKYKK